MKRVLFICVHNSGRSQMAEAFFNHLAQNKAQAISAGTKPAQQIHPVVIEAMREVGIDISNRKPKNLTFEMLDKADRAGVVFHAAHGDYPVSFVPTEDWKLDDPKGQSMEKVRQIRDEIKTMVITLVGEMV